MCIFSWNRVFLVELGLAAPQERGLNMNRKMAPATLGLVFPLVASLMATSCKKEEPPPPLPAAAVASEEPAAPLAMEPIPEPIPDAGAPVKKGVGGGAASSLTACCNALMQNAASAPEPNATYMKQAAATCGSLAAQGKDKASVAGILIGMMRGAGLPAACK
jgi:hypothetical protein